MEIRVNTLIFEVTRQCNLKCDFCLRGDAQNVKMSKDVIDAVFKKIENFYDIVFTGGEPSLNVEAIEYIFKKIKETGMVVPFWLAINGRDYSPKLVEVLLDYYGYCYSEDEYLADNCGLTVSRDIYHGDIAKENLGKYQALKFYNDSKDFSKSDKRKIINEGLAKINEIGERDIKNEETELSIDYYDDDSIIIDTIYINAKGDILGCCDLSYSSQEKYSLGNILDTTLESIVKDSINKQMIA